jgi:quaternary ammonium compound-resistance protein SugE
MNWSILFLAGLLEVAWAIGLRHSAGFTRPLPSLLTLLAMAISFYLLSLALRTLPLGTAYAVWVGIGAVGTAVAGMLLFDEPASPLKLISLVLVVAGIAGLRLAG